MDTADLLALDATAQAALVRNGEVSAHELISASLARIEALNPLLNAVIHPRFEAALEDARKPLAAGPFSGVPFLVKDLMCTNAGEPLHAGSRYLKRVGHKARGDSFLAARQRAAGLISLGRTNTPEFGSVTTTEPAAYGPTRNPWSLAHSPGGSSGGAASAVASGMVAMAHGNDGGGSIRIPAAHCGLIGLKPTRGRISFGPSNGEVWLGAACEHVLTRSVRDSAAALDATAGHLPGDPYLTAPPAAPFADAAARDPRPLRIGVMTTTPGGRLPLHPDCLLAVERAVHWLGQLGHRVETAYPGALDVEDEERHFMKVVAAWVAQGIDAVARHHGPPLEDELEPHTDIVYRMGKSLAATEYLQAQIWLQAHARAICGWWAQGFDLLLTPATTQPPPRIGAFSPSSTDPMAPLRGTVPYIAYTVPFNISGQPAISLPLHHTAEGLPTGVQAVAAMGREDLLLAVAGQLERAGAWSAVRPQTPRPLEQPHHRQKGETP